MDQQIVSYIQQQVKAGYDIRSITSFLMHQGYDPNSINEAAEFVNSQRLSSLIEYVRALMANRADPDTIKSQLLASGYPISDINQAFSHVQKKTRFPSLAIFMILVALVIFGLGLFFFWPRSGGGETASPDIIPAETDEGLNDNMGSEDITFDTESTVSFDTAADEDEGFETEDSGQMQGSDEEDIIFEQAEQASEEPLGSEEGDTEFSSETEDFEDLIDRASKESNVDSALSICEKEKNEMYKDACYDQLSKTFESSAICTKISDESLRDSCYLRIVLKSKDYSLCGSIMDSNLYSSCLSLQNTAPADNLTMDSFSGISI